jgi:lysozyme
MQSSLRIKNYIKAKETLQLHCYSDGTGHYAIGYGHTWKPGDREVITQAQADQLFANDILIAEVGVNRYLRVPLLQQEFDACVSFAFNDGIDGFKGSEVLAQLNSGQKINAFSYLPRYCHAGNTALLGLLIRRIEETLIMLGKPVVNY